jgi:hypothetical protein
MQMIKILRFETVRFQNLVSSFEAGKTTSELISQDRNSVGNSAQFGGLTIEAALPRFCALPMGEG